MYIDIYRFNLYIAAYLFAWGVGPMGSVVGRADGPGGRSDGRPGGCAVGLSAAAGRTGGRTVGRAADQARVAGRAVGRAALAISRS